MDRKLLILLFWNSQMLEVLPIFSPDGDGLDIITDPKERQGFSGLPLPPRLRWFAFTGLSPNQTLLAKAGVQWCRRFPSQSSIIPARSKAFVLSSVTRVFSAPLSNKQLMTSRFQFAP
ncbi:hypothetical protein T03_3861 [Trichinella britovi]|uniref:Uncharacterized protein n=1 Tax=Trichinella britovi TaxID=45882 RepID=A0A0V1CMI9_TRIBR|nr:hypothetical protein T03_3861 [Trichinella britovi]